MKKKSKRYKNLKETYKKKDSNKFDQVLKELKNGSGVKFVESIDISMNINLKKIKGADNNLRTLIELPHGNGKKIRVGLLCDENKLAEAKKTGAEVVGSDDLLKKITANIDLTPRGIRDHLNLHKPIYKKSAAYGHFGRDPESDGSFSWEKTDLAEKL